MGFRLLFLFFQVVCACVDILYVKCGMAAAASETFFCFLDCWGKRENDQTGIDKTRGYDFVFNIYSRPPPKVCERRILL